MHFMRAAIGASMADLYTAIMASRGEKENRVKSIWEARARSVSRVGGKPIDGDYKYTNTEDPVRCKMLVIEEGELEDDDEWAVLCMDALGRVYWFIFQVDEYCARYQRCERIDPQDSTVSNGQIYAVYTAIIGFIELVHEQSRNTEQFRGDTVELARKSRRSVDRAIWKSPLLL